MTDEKSISLQSELTYIRSKADEVYKDAKYDEVLEEPQAENVRILADSITRLTHVIEVMLINR